jgi:hypothetical protein
MSRASGEKKCKAINCNLHPVLWMVSWATMGPRVRLTQTTAITFYKDWQNVFSSKKRPCHANCGKNVKLGGLFYLFFKLMSPEGLVLTKIYSRHLKHLETVHQKASVVLLQIQHVENWVLAESIWYWPMPPTGSEDDNMQQSRWRVVLWCKRDRPCCVWAFLRAWPTQEKETTFFSQLLYPHCRSGFHSRQRLQRMKFLALSARLAAVWTAANPGKHRQGFVHNLSKTSGTWGCEIVSRTSILKRWQKERPSFCHNWCAFTLIWHDFRVEHLNWDHRITVADCPDGKRRCRTCASTMNKRKIYVEMKHAALAHGQINP